MMNLKRKKKPEAREETLQTLAVICAYCQHFDAVGHGFYASNKAKCMMDGREHWKGDFATGCPYFADNRDA